MFGNEFSKRNGNGNPKSTEMHGNGIPNIPGPGKIKEVFRRSYIDHEVESKIMEESNTSWVSNLVMVL